MIAWPAAIANAIYNAIGVRIKKLPITPDNLLEAVKEQRPELLKELDKYLLGGE